MDDRFHQLSSMILQKDLDQCSVTELQELTERYPYFSPAHFLLVKKKEMLGMDASADIQKAMIYYHDPVSFSFFMEPRKTDERFLHEEIMETSEISKSSVDTAVTSQALIQPEEHQIPTLQQPASIESNPPAETALTFEPYHTVDYFASQGIKPSKEEPKDAFGKQLRSFTEWLKTMKKLPDPALSASRPTDPAVDQMANRSISDSNVVTEAMAEVWAKQGNKEKAIDIYRKLSLLDPSKTPYFAAKIDNLKAD